MRKQNFVCLIFSLFISLTSSNEQHGEYFVTINGENYDISPMENHTPVDKIAHYTLTPLYNLSLNSPNSDAFTDLILAGARKLIKDQGLDPADLPDAVAKFSKKILGIKTDYSNAISYLISIKRFLSLKID